MDSNIMSDGNVTRPQNFYMNLKWIISQQVILIKQVYTPLTSLDVLKSLIAYYIFIF